jgi:hypothetical protein
MRRKLDPDTDNANLRKLLEADSKGIIGFLQGHYATGAVTWLFLFFDWLPRSLPGPKRERAARSV